MHARQFAKRHGYCPVDESCQRETQDHARPSDFQGRCRTQQQPGANRTTDTHHRQNDNVRQMAAELCLSLQRTGEAVKLLGELFERQVESGDNTRASLTYKKLSRYINPSVTQKIHFGQILEASNRKLAAETYENALEDLTKQGKRAECLAVLKRLVALEPSELNRLRGGELSSELQASKGAA